MELFKSPAVGDYWNAERIKPIHGITKLMSLARFQQIKRFLHISDHTNDGSSTFFFNKVQPAFQSFCEVSKQ